MRVQKADGQTDEFRERDLFGGLTYRPRRKLEAVQLTRYPDDTVDPKGVPTLRADSVSVKEAMVSYVVDKLQDAKKLQVRRKEAARHLKE